MTPLFPSGGYGQWAAAGIPTLSPRRGLVQPQPKCGGADGWTDITPGQAAGAVPGDAITLDWRALWGKWLYGLKEMCK